MSWGRVLVGVYESPPPRNSQNFKNNMAFSETPRYFDKSAEIFLNDCDPSPLKKFSIDDFARLMYDYGLPEKSE